MKEIVAIIIVVVLLIPVGLAIAFHVIEDKYQNKNKNNLGDEEKEIYENTKYQNNKRNISKNE